MGLAFVGFLLIGWGSPPSRLSACPLAPTVRKIGRAIPVHHRLHAAGLVRVSAGPFQFLDARGGPQQRHQVAPRRAAPGADVIRVQAVFLSVGAQPADRRLAVLNLRREDRVLAEPVVDGRHSVTLGRPSLARGPVAPCLPLPTRLRAPKRSPATDESPFPAGRGPAGCAHVRWGRIPGPAAPGRPAARPLPMREGPCPARHRWLTQSRSARRCLALPTASPSQAVVCRKLSEEANGVRLLQLMRS